MHRSVFHIALLVTLMFSISAQAYTLPEQPKAHDRANWVCNQQDILSRETVDSLNAICSRLCAATEVELCVIATPGEDDVDIADYNYRVFQTWGIGREGKNTGVLLTLWRDAHAVHITTGGGIEQILTDALCSRIVNDVMIPYFRADDYDRGLIAGAHTIEDICTTPDNADELLHTRSTTSRGYYAQYEREDTIATIIGIALILLGVLIVLLAYYLSRPKCSRCGKRHLRLTHEEVLLAATLTHGGRIRRHYRCRCGNEQHIESHTPRLTPIITSGSGRSGGFSGGGGYSGGGRMGGGSTFGGGAGGRW